MKSNHESRITNHERGFTLVELALVLVIVGLVIGGVVVGQDLIRGGAVRAVIGEYQTYSGAVSAFRDKYLSIPGDMTNATSFWGDNATLCADAAIANGTPGTCNGNGDGWVIEAAAASQTGEIFQFWNQLALGGFIGGYYSGASGSGGVAHCIGNSNVPRSKKDDTIWSVYSLSAPLPGTASHYAATYGNFFYIGGQNSWNFPDTPTFTAAEAFSIDTKLDDGKPGTGMILAFDRTVCANSTSATDYSSTYRISNSTNQCTIYFVRQF